MVLDLWIWEEAQSQSRNWSGSIWSRGKEKKLAIAWEGTRIAEVSTTWLLHGSYGD